MAAEELAIFATADELAGMGVLRQKRQHMSDQELFSGLLRRLHHLVAFGGRQPHRLFDEDMFAGLERSDGGAGMQMRRQADVYQFDLGIAKQPCKIGILCHAGQIHLLPWRAEVPLNSPPIAGQTLRIARADCRELDTFDVLVGQIVSPAHKADADETDVHKRREGRG